MFLYLVQHHRQSDIYPVVIEMFGQFNVFEMFHRSSDLSESKAWTESAKRALKYITDLEEELPMRRIDVERDRR